MRIIKDGLQVQQGMSRRGFMGATVASGLAALLARRGAAHAMTSDEETGTGAAIPSGKAKHCIVLFMTGGPSHMDSFDPKPGHEWQGETEVVKTKIPGVKIAAAMPLLAERARDLCIVRSMTSKEGNHSRARYLLHTGYAPNPTVTHPAFGALVSHEVGREDFDLPNYVQINGGGGESGGYLGVTHNPFVIQRPDQPIANLALPPGVSEKRVDKRMELLAAMDSEFAKTRGTEVPEARQVMYGKSRKLMKSPLTKAFDLSTVSEKERGRWGEGNFAQGCLMAARLVEAGVNVVEVTLGGWDTHENNWERVPQGLEQVDRGFAGLIDRLKANGKLDETLILWMGEFGRTPKPNSRGGRDHYPRAWSLAMAGGGVVGGQVVGSTTENAAEVAERPITVPDLFASLSHAFGMNQRKTFYAGERPITLVDKAGKVVPEFFV